jgi:hypothetical protein
MTAWWQKQGFAEAPKYVTLAPGTPLYRVCGGPTNLPFGSFYLFEEPTTVSSAERQLNIVKWGNRCFYFLEFSVLTPIGVHVGRIGQDFGTPQDGGGADYFEWIPGRRTQAFLPVEQARKHLRIIGTARPLIQDVSVVIPRQRLDA